MQEGEEWIDGWQMPWERVAWSHSWSATRRNETSGFRYAIELGIQGPSQSLQTLWSHFSLLSLELHLPATENYLHPLKLGTHVFTLLRALHILACLLGMTSR